MWRQLLQKNKHVSYLLLSSVKRGVLIWSQHALGSRGVTTWDTASFTVPKQTKHPENIKIVKAQTTRKAPMQACLQALHKLSTLKEKDFSRNYQNYKEIELTCEEHISIQTHTTIKAKSLILTKTTISNFKLWILVIKGKKKEQRAFESCWASWFKKTTCERQHF